MKANIEKKVEETIRKYKLLSKEDKILVACSGGKDSTTILYILNKLGYGIEALFIDLFIGEHSEKNKKNIRKFCSKLGVKLHEVSVKEFTGYSICYMKSVLNSKGNKMKSCAICGSVKRYILNKYAKKLGKTKLVTGHNLDDEAQNFMMNLLKGRVSMNARLGPKAGVVNDKKFVARVKPLYFCSEKEIKEYSKFMKFPVVYEHCPCSVDAFRRFLKGQLDELEKENPTVKLNIINYFIEKKLKLKNKGVGYCEKCGEPCSDKICSMCRLVKALR
ncbi:MAG: TIGR00269 family protein [Candidatus Woesearchaeota archaeon]|jgi:uncharacterized protein (TIGR00269 family)|nr:TIGR00269 family protein [Candidatus Woesearchaeota archaeon]MDP7506034.1 TIGR00269 family protein [Candidatus Woesearchaeota archaeon]|tara:strand:- start:821 stop:1645 length:825 start_codon:yes stop_codon:yes gene_type:complete